MTEQTYVNRPHIFAPERTYRLLPDALAWSDGRSDGRVAYRDVTQVWISGSPKRLRSRHHRCVVRHPGGKLVLAAAHYVRFGVVEERTAAYEPFVRELLRRVAAAAPGCTFIAGQPWAAWVVWLLILIGGGAVLAGAVVLLVQGKSVPSAIAATGIGLFALTKAWRSVFHDRPRRFDPRAGDAVLS